MRLAMHPQSHHFTVIRRTHANTAAVDDAPRGTSLHAQRLVKEYHVLLLASEN